MNLFIKLRRNTVGEQDYIVFLLRDITFKILLLISDINMRGKGHFNA